MDLFEMRTGKFTPLCDAQLVKLDDVQRVAYADLKSAISQLDATNAEVESAITANREVVAVLHAAEKAEAKKPKYTRLDALREAQEQWRRDHP